MKKFLTLFLAFFAFSLFAGCSDKGGEEGGEENAAAIVGTWHHVRATGSVKINGQVDESWDDNVSTEQMFLTFKKDGSGVQTSGGEEDLTFTYSVSGKKLTVRTNDGDVTEMEIRTLTKKDLVVYLSEIEVDGNDRYEYQETMYLVRK